MKRLLLRCLGTIALLAGTIALGRADETPASTPAPAPSDQWVTAYYRNPQPERFVEEIRDLSRQGILSKAESRAPLLGFLSQVFAQNPQRIVPWMTALDDLPAADQKTLQTAIWFSFRPEGIAYLESKGLKEYQAKLPPDLLTLEVNTPETLDILWGYFLATGKEAPIRRIVSAYNLAPYAGSAAKFKSSQQTDADKKAALRDATLQAAIWSLRSNYRQHARVREICEGLIQESALNGEERRGLLALLEKERPEKDQRTWQQNGQPIGDQPNMKVRNGFGAQLFLTEDTAFFENWNKPATPHLHNVTQARRNIPVHTVLLLTNPGLDANTANVTADITVLKPDGSVYANTPNVTCWKGKYNAPSANLQLAQGHMAIRIEPQDPAGHYTVRILIRDRVKQVEIPLETGFDVAQ
ncbi:MAG: hypothetical protein PHQ12_10210 [Chthoniobacteraceae bacterium]|nr:hypothetical protein [Chthoniobacteraceae bacterium]